MAKRAAPLPAENEDNGDDEAAPKLTSLAVDIDIANQIRALSKKHRINTVEITNQLLGHALKQGKIAVEVKTVVISLGR